MKNDEFIACFNIQYSKNVLHQFYIDTKIQPVWTNTRYGRFNILYAVSC